MMLVLSPDDTKVVYEGTFPSKTCLVTQYTSFMHMIYVTVNS